MIVTRLSDKRIFTEDQLGELLREEGRESASVRGLAYCDGQWFIGYFVGAPAVDRPFESFVLDPLKYTVSDPSFISREEVTEMVEEIRSEIQCDSVPSKDYGENLNLTGDVLRLIGEISSKYLSPK